MQSFKYLAKCSKWQLSHQSQNDVHDLHKHTKFEPSRKNVLKRNLFNYDAAVILPVQITETGTKRRARKQQQNKTKTL